MIQDDEELCADAVEGEDSDRALCELGENGDELDESDELDETAETVEAVETSDDGELPDDGELTDDEELPAPPTLMSNAPGPLSRSLISAKGTARSPVRQLTCRGAAYLCRPSRTPAEPSRSA